MNKNPNDVFANIPDVFDYSDYCAYLRARFEGSKQYSHQILAQKFGLSHKIQVYRIFKGERKLLPEALIEKISQACAHDEREKQYFRALVKFREARTLEQKNKAYTHLHEIIRPVSKRTLGKSEFEYLQNWFTPVIRELMTMEGVTLTPQEISKQLLHKVGVEQVEKAMELIENLGLVSRDESGSFRQNHKKLCISDEESALAARNFQQKHFEVLKQAQQRSGKYLNRFICATFGGSEGGTKMLNAKLEQFMEEMGDMMSHMENDKDQVYQFNIQLYPLTKRISGEIK
jgi:uncharacterized protein (TIGR02147 family)